MNSSHVSDTLTIISINDIDREVDHFMYMIVLVVEESYSKLNVVIFDVIGHKYPKSKKFRPFT